MEFQSNYSEIEVVLLEDIFKKVFSKYTTPDIVDNLFEHVYKSYTQSNRYYHNVNHISYMCGLWEINVQSLKDADAIFFAIIYHDIIYKSRKNDNEEKSAEYFKINVAPILQLPQSIADKVYDAILATKHNESSKLIWEKDTDIQYLLDFDLAILGTEFESTYEWYRKGVRKEYKIYPNFMYKPGRKKVLESFLKRDKIYITKNFKKSFEKNARKNLQNEINSYLC